MNRTNKDDTGSTYYHNGIKIKKENMEKVLEFHKIDIKTSRFLILQFEVKNISEMPPKSKEMDIEKRYDSSPGLLE